MLLVGLKQKRRNVNVVNVNSIESGGAAWLLLIFSKSGMIDLCGWFYAGQLHPVSIHRNKKRSICIDCSLEYRQEHHVV